MYILSNWDTTSGVRSLPRRLLGNDLSEGKKLFPPRLVPHLDHPLVADLDSAQRDRLLVRSLYQYLEFTIHIETSLVNSATIRIAKESLPMTVSDATRLDALKIYTDEAYHALFSMDLIHQIEGATKSPRVGSAASDARAYDRGRQYAAEPLLLDYPILAELVQAVIMETAITSILSDIPNDDSIATVVRAVIADHARDEKVHHAFFSHIFRELWATLSQHQRALVGRAVPQMMLAILGPRRTELSSCLRSVGITPDQTREVIADIYTDQHAKAQVRRIGRAAIALFVRVGMLNDRGVAEGFHEAGLT